MPNTPSVRSDTLIHWTEPLEIRNKRNLIKSQVPTLDFDKEYDKHNHFRDAYEPHDGFRKAYLCLLKNICKRGLRYSSNTEKVIRGTLGTAACLPSGNIICYTELHPHQSKAHARRYGELGIGFSRHRLLHPYGANPVFYLPNIGEGIVSTNLQSIVGNRSLIPALEQGYMAFIKPMSEYFKHMENEPHELEYYDEMEWRMIPPGTLILPDGSPQTFPWCYPDNGYCYFRFPFSAVSRIIVPDAETREMVRADGDIQECFAERMPDIKTLEETMSRQE